MCAVDVHLYGMTLYQLATGSRPFRENGEMKVVTLFNYLNETQRPTIHDDVHKGRANLVTMYWDPVPDKRPLMSWGKFIIAGQN